MKNYFKLMRWVSPVRRCRGRSRRPWSACPPVWSDGGGTRAPPRLWRSSWRGPAPHLTTGVRMQRRRRRRSVFILRISLPNRLLTILVIFSWCARWWWTCSGWFWRCSSDTVCFSSGLVARWSRRRWVIFTRVGWTAHVWIVADDLRYTTSSRLTHCLLTRPPD